MNLSQLKSDVNFLARCTSATYPDTDKVRNMNIAYNDVARLIWESQGDWQYDDSNSTTLPIAKGTLVHNQQDYSLPSTTQRIYEINIKDNGGTYQKLKPIDWMDITVAPTQYQSTAGMPLYYDLVGRSIMLYPTPHSASVTLASGIAVYVNRDVTEFATTGTTTTPGFATSFHRILSYAAAIDFEQDESMKKSLVLQKDRLEKGLTRFYSKRPEEFRTNMKPASKKRWRQLI